MEQLTLPVSEANIKPAVQNVPLLLLAVRVITHVCLQVSSPPSPPPPEELSSNLPLFVLSGASETFLGRLFSFRSRQVSVACSLTTAFARFSSERQIFGGR